MEHLSLEALARLVDESPFRSERQHLARCQDCSRELELLREQSETLGSLPDLRPAPGDWPALEARLESEGLLHGSGTSHASSRAAAGIRLIEQRRGWMQIAAALVIFIAGGFSGAALAPAGSASEAGSGVEIAASEAATPEEAAEVLRLAEQQYRLTEQHYRDAVLRYRVLSRSLDAELPMDVRHFAALETLVAASQAAVQEAPDDPYLNGFLVSAVAERDAALNSFFASADRY